MQTNAPTPIMIYSAEEGIKAGGGSFVSEGGAYIATITEAKYCKAKTGTSGIEFSIETSDGLKAQFITVYYAKADSTPVKSGNSILNAMMGLLNIPSITALQSGAEYICPELTGKVIGLFLQKVLYTKNDMSEGYKFDIRVPYAHLTSCTLKEAMSNSAPKTIENMSNSYKDKDDRKAAGSAPQDQGYMAPDNSGNPYV